MNTRTLLLLPFFDLALISLLCFKLQFNRLHSLTWILSIKMQTVDFLLAVCQPTVGCLLAICQLLLVGAGHLLADCWLLAGHILHVNFTYSLPIHISLYVISISLMPMEICIERLCGKLTWNICHLLTDCWLFAVHLLGAC